MIIPNFEHSEIVDLRTKEWTDNWSLIMQQLITQLQKNLSNEGYILPQQSTSNINALNISQYIGALIYDSTQNLIFGNLNGTFKRILQGIAKRSPTFAGGGTTFTITDSNCTTNSIVLANIQTSTNSVSINKATAGAGSITIIFSADPGAGTVINYIII